MAIYDMELSDTLSFTESADGGNVESDLRNDLILHDIYCTTQEINLTLSDTLTLIDYLAVNFPSLSNRAGAGASGIRGPSGVSLPVIHRLRLFDTLEFREQFEGTGGMVLNLACTPAHYEPDIPVFDWDTFLGSEWDELTSEEYDIMIGGD